VNYSVVRRQATSGSTVGPNATIMTLSAIERPAAYERIRRALNCRFVAAFVLSFWSLCGVLPLRWASALGGFVMGIGGLYVRRMRKVRANLEIALPNLSSSEQNRLARDMRYNLGRTWSEFPHLAEICRPGSPWVDIRGSENYEREIAAGRPVVFVSGHLGNWEITAGTVAHRNTPLTVVYSPNRNPVIERRIHRYRQALRCGLVPKQSAARLLVKALSVGESVGLVVDQRVKDGVLIPFFGRAAPTTMLPARLALKFRASIVPVRCQRLGGARFCITFHEPIRPEDVPHGSDPEIALTTRINGYIEDWIRGQPADWYCMRWRWPRGANGG
jgi:KDO2-lipid IV(A) lauroyltransferase